MKFENTEVAGFRSAIRAMRNPLASWSKSDSYTSEDGTFILGDADKALAQRLIKAGSEHRKFLRQIYVAADITAPAYYMSEFDTYKIGTTRNSTSFMHKGVSKPFEVEDFGFHDERLFAILTTRDKQKDPIPYYPYETDEYKVFVGGNGREYEVYRNGKIMMRPFSYTDTMGRHREYPYEETKPTINKGGYLYCNLGGRKGRSRWQVHRLVATMWIPNPNGYATIDHINGNKKDNSVENLEWVTLEENIRRGYETGLLGQPDIRKNYRVWKNSIKLNPYERNRLRAEYKEGASLKELSEKYGLEVSGVWALVHHYHPYSPNVDLFEDAWHIEQTLKYLNHLREKYLETKDYKYFLELRQCLPQAYLYTSTVSMNYEVVRSMVLQRKNHRLPEWNTDFIAWSKELPYSEELIWCGVEDDE